jgi:hypothetical protein
MPPLRKHAATIILVFFVGLGILYSLITPVFEASDEIHHYPYVQNIAIGQGLPLQHPGEQALWAQEGSQPPLYYAVCALLTGWINTHDLPAVRYLNPHARIGLPLARDNKNMVVHTAQEAFPWHDTTLAVHLLRLFSVLLGAGTVRCTYRLALSLVPHHPTLALGAMALNAFNPMFLFISASVNNDNLVVFLASVSLLILVRYARYNPTRRQLVGLGVLIGLGCLTKLSALGLIPLAALVLALRQFPIWRQTQGIPIEYAHPSLRHAATQWLVECLLVFVPTVLVAGWWYLRNWQLYGDPLGLNIMLDIAGRRPETPTIGQLLSEFQGFRINFWGLFGAVNILLRPRWIYYILDGLTVLAVLGLFVQTWRVWRTRDVSRHLTLLIPATWIGIEGVALIRWTLSTFASQGRLIFPAISAIGLFMVLGLVAWLPKRWWPPLVIALATGMFLLAATAPFVAIRPAYARSAILTAADVPASARRINVTYGDVMRLLAYNVDRTAVRPGQAVAVTLYWESLAPMSEDFSIYIQLFGWQKQRMAQIDTYPGGGTYPTSLWSVGQVIRDTYYLSVYDDAGGSGPVAAELEVGLYRLATMQRLPATDERGQTVGRTVLTRIKIIAPSQPASPSQTLDANLGNRAHLIGYDLASQTIQPGATVPLTLYWRVTDRLERDYQVFVQLVSDQGAIIGQGDGPPLENAYPTSFWASGETLRDPHRLVVRDDAPSGPARIVVGLYDLTTGQRLSVLDSTGTPTGDHIVVTNVQVTAKNP